MKLISVIVPVKGSYVFLKSIIDQTLRVDSDEIELVIQDNTPENTEILDYLKVVSSPNICYFHQSQPLTMTQNFEEGIKNSKGKYLCILGADDNFSIHLLDVVSYLATKNIQSAVVNKAIYYWPGMKFKAHQNRPNFTIRKYKSNIRRVKIQNELEKLLSNGMVSIGDLPSPYQGIIKRELLEEVKLISGRYIPGACPDMAMAIALTSVVEDHVYLDIPVIISGQSYNSAGGKGARGEHKGDLKNKTFLPVDIEKNWPSFLPKIWTGPTIYIDSLVSASKSMGNEKITDKLNIEANYASIISFFPEYLRLVSTYVNRKPSSVIKLTVHVLQIIIKRTKFFILNMLKTKFGITSEKLYREIQTSLDACIILDEEISAAAKGISSLVISD
jgi:glycosyltransferase involved in cell wall biosynthesis